MPVSKRTAAQQALVPYWRSECERAVVYVGDCRTVMPQLEQAQFHAVVTDPPYELKFMSRTWDGTGVAYDVATWKAVMSVALPGAHLLSFGGTRTFHRSACAIEDTGWEIRDCIIWMYGSGFPKSHDVSKAVDKELGAKRQKVKHDNPRNPKATGGGLDGTEGATRPWIERALEVGYHEKDGSEPATDAATQWQGYGTALKPSYEPVIVARKPLIGTVAQNVLEHGCGGLNIDGCRIGSDVITTRGNANMQGGNYNNTRGTEYGLIDSQQHVGRWPANLIHDGSDEVVELFPVTNPTKPHAGDGKPIDTREQGWGFTRTPSSLSDNGGSAARFFYTAKADNSDRPHGKGAAAHPTVKPLDLMRYLVRLVCAPGGRVLDPFMGSGSTGVACLEEGMYFVGIEQSQEYADIAVGRLKLALLSSAKAAPELQKSKTAEAAKPAQQATPPSPKRLRG